MATEMATAIRATALVVRGLFGQHRRTFRYDALFPDGHIERDVDMDKAIHGSRYPADAWATRHAATATCPDVGTGRWVEYASGRVLDDPAGS